MPIVPDEERWNFVSFLTSTSTCWRCLTDVPSQGNGCPRRLAVPFLASLLRQARHMLLNSYKGTKSLRGVALLACDLLYGRRGVEPYTAIGLEGRTRAPTDGSCCRRRATMPQHRTTRVSLRA